MITITKEIKITIDKGDVPVLKDICGIARRHMTGFERVVLAEVSEERVQEIHKFLKIISEEV